MKTLNLASALILLTFSTVSQAKETTIVTDDGRVICSIESSNGLEYHDGPCSFGAAAPWHDKFECITGMDEKIEVLVQNYRISYFQVHAFGKVFKGYETSLISNNIPNGLAVHTNDAGYGEPETLTFHTNKYSQNPNESLPNLLTVYLSEGRAPWGLELNCEQVY